MNSAELSWIIKTTLKAISLEVQPSLVNNLLQNARLSALANSDVMDKFSFLENLFKQLKVNSLTYRLHKEEVDEFFKENNSSLIAFKRNNHTPVLITRRDKDLYYLQSSDGEKLLKLSSDDLMNELEGEDGKLAVLLCFADRPYFSDPEKVLNPLTRFIRMLQIEKQEILLIYAYAIFNGLISLSLPLGVQSIISYVMGGGAVSTSVVVLITVIITAVILSGVLQISQITLVEYLQRRIFVRTALDLAYKLPKVRMEKLNEEYPPELMNRFIEAISLQKSISKVLIDMSSAILQIFFGMLLLSFYHQFFIFFNMILLVAIFIIFRFNGPRGLEGLLKESKYKYKVLYWLQEVGRNITSFKLKPSSDHHLLKTDILLGNYLQARNNYFNILVRHYWSMIMFKTLVTGGMLIIGTLLVIGQQINLGQFVAAEIIILLVLTATEKMIFTIEKVYDVLVSSEKIGLITDMETERIGGFLNRSSGGKGIHLKVQNLSFKFKDSSTTVINHLDFEVNSGELFCIAGYSASGKNTLSKIISGLYENYSGLVSFDNVSLRDLSLDSIRNSIGTNLSNEEIFEGTVLENIIMGREGMNLEEISKLTENLGINQYINRLSHGFNTPLISGSQGISYIFGRKLILARAIAAKPRLLVIEDVFYNIEKSEKKHILDYLLSLDFKPTIVLISNEPEILSRASKIMVLKEGSKILEGSFDELKDRPELLQIM